MKSSDKEPRGAILLLVILVLGTLGLGASIYLTISHYSILSGDQLEGSFCQISEVVDCDSVAASRYSDFLGIPWSSAGSIAYMLVISLGIFGFAVRKFRSFSLRTVFLIAMGSVLFDTYLAVIGFFVLRKVCLVCILTYCVNLSLLYYSKRGTGEPLKVLVRTGLKGLFFLDSVVGENQLTVKRLYYGLNGVIVFFGIAIASLLHWHYAGSSYLVAEKLVDALRKQAPVGIDLVGTPCLGNPNARIHLVEFSDFRCPYCKKMASVLQVIRKRYPEDVAVCFKHYPLDAECNGNIQKTLHVDSCKIARMAICAQQMNLFWDMQDLFFTTDQFFIFNLKRSLESRNIPPARLLGCESDPRTKQTLSRDIEQARECGVDLIPTLFVNGRKIVGYQNPNVLSAVIEAMLSGRM